MKNASHHRLLATVCSMNTSKEVEDPKNARSLERPFMVSQRAQGVVDEHFYATSATELQIRSSVVLGHCRRSSVSESVHFGNAST